MNFLHIFSILFTLLSLHAVFSLCGNQYNYTIRFEKYFFSPSRLEHFKSSAEDSISYQGGRIIDRFEDGFRCTTTREVIIKLIRYLTTQLPPSVSSRDGLPIITRDPDQSATRSKLTPRQMRADNPMRDEQRPEVAEQNPSSRGSQSQDQQDQPAPPRRTQENPTSRFFSRFLPSHRTASEQGASQQTTQQGSTSSIPPATLGFLPFRRFYARQSTVLIMKPKVLGLLGDDWVTVKDSNGDPVFKVRAERFSLSHRVVVSDPEGQRLYAIRKERSFLTPFKAYAEGPQGARFFEFNGLRSFGTWKNNISFINAADGQNVQLQMKMGMFNKTLDIRLADTDTVIANIERPMWFSTKYVMTITPNVDTSLVLAMCICLYQRIQEVKRAAASGANHVAGGVSGGPF